MSEGIGEKHFRLVQNGYDLYIHRGNSSMHVAALSGEVNREQAQQMVDALNAPLSHALPNLTSTAAKDSDMTKVLPSTIEAIPPVGPVAQEVIKALRELADGYIRDPMGAKQGLTIFGRTMREAVISQALARLSARSAAVSTIEAKTELRKQWETGEITHDEAAQIAIDRLDELERDLAESERKLDLATDALGEAHGRAAEMAESMRAESAPSAAASTTALAAIAKQMRERAEQLEQEGVQYGNELAWLDEWAAKLEAFTPSAMGAIQTLRAVAASISSPHAQLLESGTRETVNVPMTPELWEHIKANSTTDGAPQESAMGDSVSMNRDLVIAMRTYVQLKRDKQYAMGLDSGSTDLLLSRIDAALLNRADGTTKEGA
jgi:hypothetical protein